MHVAVYLALLVPVLVVAAPRVRPGAVFVADHLRPSTVARLLTLLGVGLATCSTLALVLLVTAGLAGWASGPGDSWSISDLPADDSLAPATALVAGVVVVALAVRVVAALGRLVAQYRAAAAAVPAGATAGEPLLVTDAHTPACAVPVRGGHVLVCARTWATLGPERRAVVLAHERAHLRGRHHLHRGALALAVAANPLVAPVAAAADYALERWAEEDDPAEVRDRRATARTVGAVALAAAGRAARPPAPPALGVIAGPVPRRVAALLAPGPPALGTVRGAVIGGLLVGLALGAAALVGHAAVDLDHLLAPLR
ncbi:M56 family metallopeptidase [Actinomycetospora chlora]|uniref:M56 family metallopeptidase n=1 Tax=Actinomycetospora chlora TaxID=663608 RepID=A0ABP9B5B9_9PSEU